MARIAGDASRRLNEGWLDIWDETAQPQLQSQGGPMRDRAPDAEDPADPAQNAALRSAEVGRLLSRGSTSGPRANLNARIISAFENALIQAGRLEARPASSARDRVRRPVGLHLMTVEHGDEAAATAADRLRGSPRRPSGGRRPAGQAPRRRRPAPVPGRAVRDPGDAAPGRPRIDAAGLPRGHAGIAAGRVVVRDGDVFGATVNLASRIADTAKPGEVVVEEGIVIALPRGTADFDPIGRVELKGFPVPVALWRAVAPAERPPRRR